MNDTPPNVEASFNALFIQRSGSDRVRMACDMFDLARKLVIANIEIQNPDIRSADLRVKIFERIYRDDFDTDQCTRIIRRLRD